jgi:hypothetical protein
MKASSRCLLCTLLLGAVLWAQAIPAGFAASDQPGAKPAGGEWSDPVWPREFPVTASETFARLGQKSVPAPGPLERGR